MSATTRPRSSRSNMLVRMPDSTSAICSRRSNSRIRSSISSMASCEAPASRSTLASWRSASSSRPRIRESGVRRSWAMALETWRMPSISSSMRSSMRLMSRFRRANSSSPLIAMRWLKSPASMRAAVPRISPSLFSMVRRNSKAPATVSSSDTPAPASSASQINSRTASCSLRSRPTISMPPPSNGRRYSRAGFRWPSRTTSALSICARAPASVSPSACGHEPRLPATVLPSLSSSWKISRSLSIPSASRRRTSSIRCAWPSALARCSRRWAWATIFPSRF